MGGCREDVGVEAGYNISRHARVCAHTQSYTHNTCARVRACALALGVTRAHESTTHAHTDHTEGYALTSSDVGVVADGPAVAAAAKANASPIRRMVGLLWCQIRSDRFETPQLPRLQRVV